MRGGDGEPQRPRFVDLQLTGKVRKGKTRITRIVKKLILKIDLIHYRHPLRNLNVMLVTPVTDTSLSNG